MKHVWEYAVLLLVLLAGFISAQQNVTTTDDSDLEDDNYLEDDDSYVEDDSYLGDSFSGIPYEVHDERCGNDPETRLSGGCACDPACREHGDCCLDSPFFKPEQQKLGASPFICDTLSSLYMMPKCSSHWADPVVRHRCEHPDATFRDPMRDAPVTSLATNITYVNSYCAACHRDLHPDTMEIWNLKIDCKIDPDLLNFTAEQYIKHLAYDTDASEWYLNLTTDNENTHYHCRLFPEIPYGITNRTRWCEPHVVSSCLEDWTDDAVKDQCEAYTSHICSRYSTFRNRYCAVCNNVALEPWCVKGTFAIRSLALLDWRSAQQIQHCDHGELYDPLSALCRAVIDIDKSN